MCCVITVQCISTCNYTQKVAKITNFLASIYFFIIVVSFHSESLFMDMADRLVEDGYKDAGYVYVNVDDCYMEKHRDSYNRLVPHRMRFPNGMRKLGEYVRTFSNECENL